jgi:2-octaprenyl-6-methoxyphenol hydroxylase
MAVRTNESCDIAVVGAGAAGLCAALAFARDGFGTILVGSVDAKRDGRTLALLNGSVRLLEALGVWSSVMPQAAPLETMRLIDDTGSLFRPPPVAFRAAEIGLDAFGWNVENVSLVSVLADSARAAGRVKILPGQAVSLDVSGGLAELILDSGDAVTAALVVAADGRNSVLRRAAAISAKTWSYPQTALTAILAHDKEHRETSTEFHTRQGPFTLVPLPGRRSSLVWVTDPERARALSELTDDVLAFEIERQAHSLLGAMRIEGPRGVVPISGLSVGRYCAPRLALVGEAAHVFPPIGAQGLNLGMRDVASLRDAVVDSRSAGRDIGGSDCLARYQRSRDLDVRLRTAAVDSLNRTLLSGLLPVDFLRGVGLLALGQIGFLRRIVMREGVLPRIGAPSLMQGDGETAPSPQAGNRS